MTDEIESPLDLKDKRRQPIALNVKCSSCIFFSDRAHQSFKKPCSQLGVKKYSRPCKYYFANPFQFTRKDEEYKLIKQLITQHRKRLPDLVGWLNQEVASKKTGFEFGQTVYVRMIGEDYLLNYAKATVISANKQHVYIQGKKFRGTYLHGSIFTEDQWKRKKKSLVKHTRIRDPAEKSYYKIKVTPKKAIDYEVPTIDDFSKVYESKQLKKKVLSVTPD